MANYIQIETASTSNSLSPNRVNENNENVPFYVNNENVLFNENAEITPDQMLEKFSAWNFYLQFIWLSMASVWGVNAMPIMVGAFLISGGCTTPNMLNCTPRTGSIVAEFNLTGNRAKYLDYMTSMFLGGVTFGSAILPVFSDKNGRRPVLLICLFFVGVFGFFAALAPNIILFTAFRFLQGAFFTGCGVTNWILAYESIPRTLRAYTALSFGLFWVIGYFAVGPLAYFIDQWRWLMVAISAPAIISFIAYVFTIPESFHFTVSQNNQDKLIRWIERANYFTRNTHITNNASEFSAALIRHNQRNSTNVSEEVDPKTLLQHLIGNHLLLLYTIVMGYLWTCDTFVYYGLSLYSARLAGNEYVNFALMALIEVPSYIVSPFMLNILGRRVFVSLCHFIAAVSFFLVPFCLDSTLLLCVWLLGKFGISCAFTCLFVYASELFPTTVRNGCIGVCTVVACIGGVVAPLVQSMATISHVIPTLVFGISATIGGALTLILPETRGMELPDCAREMPNQDNIVGTVVSNENIHPTMSLNTSL